jgi:hypothetical protein
MTKALRNTSKKVRTGGQALRFFDTPDGFRENGNLARFTVRIWQ